LIFNAVRVAAAAVVVNPLSAVVAAVVVIVTPVPVIVLNFKTLLTLSLKMPAPAPTFCPEIASTAPLTAVKLSLTLLKAVYKSSPVPSFGYAPMFSMRSGGN